MCVFKMFHKNQFKTQCETGLVLKSISGEHPKEGIQIVACYITHHLRNLFQAPQDWAYLLGVCNQLVKSAWSDLIQPKCLKASASLDIKELKITEGRVVKAFNATEVSIYLLHKYIVNNKKIKYILDLSNELHQFCFASMQLK